MPKILALTGGVGGAKLALGLSKILSPEELIFAVNIGDDFTHLGLHISPDIDSLTYALAETNNTELGWGRAGETWQFIETLESLGGDSWFRLGDKDMALHMQRTQLLYGGASLTEATQGIAEHLNISHRIAPISNDPVRTIVHTDMGALAFQHYFVRERCKPAVSGFDFDGIDQATLNPLVIEHLKDCDGVVICPSNPYVSVDPILNVPGFREALGQTPVIAVSPIVGGIAIKGPAAKMMRELSVPASASAVAAHYDGLIHGFIVDETDQIDTNDIKIPTIATQTIMVTLEDRVNLAQDALAFLADLTA